VRYTDPSGHVICLEDGYCFEPSEYTQASHLRFYGITLTGDWSINFRDGWAVLAAAQAAGSAFTQAVGLALSHGGQVFRSVFRGGIEFYGGTDRPGLSSDCAGIGSGGCTTSEHLINFQSMGGIYPNRPAHVAFQMNMNNVVHELAHAFAHLWYDEKYNYDPSGPYGSENPIPVEYLNNEGFYFYPKPESASLTWRQHPCNAGDIGCGNETCADMFLGWTFGKWADDRYGKWRNEYMTTNMADWVPAARHP
jgi:hypothetical protein